MRDALRVYGAMVRAAFLSRLAYRGDFLVGIVGVFVLNGATLGTTWVLLHRFQTLHGWTFYQILFLYNLWLLGHGIRVVFFRHVHSLETYIVEGTFDQFLIRPADPLLQFLAKEVHYMGIGDVLVSLTSIAISYRVLGLHWNLGETAWFVVVALASACVELSMIMILSSAAFVTGRSQALVATATQFSFGVVQQYPIDIFHQGLKTVVTVVLPFAFMNYYPSLYFLHKTSLAPLPWLPFASPAVAMLLLALALLAWKWGIRRYASTGS
jgi:ABC-2 type transport system permease protein